jgi:hypothetical protein
METTYLSLVPAKLLSGTPQITGSIEATPWAIVLAEELKFFVKSKKAIQLSSK